MFNYVRCRLIQNTKRFSTKNKNKNKNDLLLKNHKKIEEETQKQKETKALMRNHRKQSLPQCLVLHPVFTDNKGPILETYLAEEAVGLAKSLDWTVVKGPYWKSKFDSTDPNYNKEDVDIEKEENITNTNDSKPKDGDYVFAGKNMKGIFYQGGVIAGGSDDEDENIYDEWKNVLLRESIALSGLVKVRRIKASTFFTKGRLDELGNFIQKKPVDTIFINTTLSFVQKRNLEIMFNNYVNEKNDRIRHYNIKSALKIDGDATDTESNFSNVEVDSNNPQERKVKVLDRFNIILSIFAQRAKSKISQLQIELAYLRYVKTRLARGGHVSYGAVYREFGGDFFNEAPAEVEVVSAKQSTIKGSIGGSGETQLEIEKRRIDFRENQIKNELVTLAKRRQIERESRRTSINPIPTVALVGYTNAGKTALVNSLAGSGLESENKLFQTLTTSLKKVFLPNKQNILLLDTVGFITDLPHELVESFKTTLEEIFYADILIHIIDISNPCYVHQKETVYKVLDEIFPKETNYRSKLVEVWNKIDLLEDVSKCAAFISENNEYPVVPISVSNRINYEMLFVEVVKKLNKTLGKELRIIRSPYHTQDKLFKWLKENIGTPTEIEYDPETSDVELKIYMTEAEYQRYSENFVIMRENKKKKDSQVFKGRKGN